MTCLHPIVTAEAGRASFITGDVFDVLATIPDGSVDLVLTSPPFLALRSYLPADHPDKHREIGSEPDPASFLATLLALTAEWRRVLAPHGSICVELGDTYSGSGGAGGDYAADGLRAGQGKFDGSSSRSRSARSAQSGQSPSHPSPNSEYGAPHERHLTEAIAGAYGGGANRVGTERHADGFTGRRGHGAGGGAGWPLPKSLCGIPHLYHLSLAYGRNLLTGEPCEPWRVRNVVAWCRPNPPVGALGDKFRPATSYMTIACPSGSRYFDLDAVRTPSDYKRNDAARATPPGKRPNGCTDTVNPAGAPPLDWWEIPTTPYSGAHYAAFPPALLERPIKSMAPSKVCTVCGEPSRRIVTATDYDMDRSSTGRPVESLGGGHRPDRPSASPETVGWTDCGHGDAYRPGIVLDPFGGSGTTLSVATGYGHHAIGIDLDPRNVDLARDRVGPMFLDEFTLDEWKNRGPS